MPVKIALMNQKGGVAKTTSCESIAAAFTKMGLRTLVIDMDAQASASQHCGFDYHVRTDFLSMYDVLSPVAERPCSLSDCIQHCNNFDLAPASDRMAALEAQYDKSSPTFFLRLRNVIEKDEKVMNGYDVIMIDSGPTKSLTSTIILCAIDYCLIPTECTGDSVEGIEGLRKSVEEIKSVINPKLDIAGIFITKYQQNTTLGKALLHDIQKYGKSRGIQVFMPPVRICVAVSNAQIRRQNIMDYAPSSNLAVDYIALANEIANSLSLVAKGE